MRLPLVALVVANLVPLFGVMFLGWSLFAIMLIYWLENIVIGVWNVVRMLTARNNDEHFMSVLFLAGFFTVHYGGFCAGHGVFVFVLFGGDGFTGPTTGPADFPPGLYWQVIFAVIGLFISHGISYFSNFIGKQEYLKVKGEDLMHRPYGRIILLHFTLIMGGWIIMALHQPFLGLLLFIGLKIAFDAKAHLKSHKKLQALEPITTVNGA